MKTSIWMLAVAVLGLAMSSCGHETENVPSASHASFGTSSTSHASAKLDADEDSDNRTGSRYDVDDAAVIHYGHAAGSTDQQSITSVVRHYYQAAVASNGAKGCSLLDSLTVESAPEQLAGDPDLRGDTCSTVVTKLFTKHHQELARDLATLEVTLVRVRGRRGLELLRFGTVERRVLVHRESGAWKVSTLLDIGIP